MERDYQTGYNQLAVAIHTVLPLLRHARLDLTDAIELLEQKQSLCERHLYANKKTGGPA